MPISWLDKNNYEFPPLECATESPNGLLAVGGDLSTGRLLAAYRHGIFPWYEEDQPLLWWSPDPRLVLIPGRMKVSRSLRRFLRQQTHTVTFDENFPAVIRACAGTRKNADGTWITADMQTAYNELHCLHHAHSVEVWREDELVGGLYGVAIGQMFFGESMFSHEPNASKLGLLVLSRQLQDWGFQMIDCQVITQHLVSLGAVAISRLDFSRQLRNYVAMPDRPGPWRCELTIEQLADEL